MITMYKPKVNSPELITKGELNTTAGQVTVSDASAYRAEDLPIPMTLGEGEGAETVLVTAIEGNLLTIEREFQGSARIWPSGTIMARYFTAYDQEAMQGNLLTLNDKKAERDNVLEKNNETEYTPTGDYHPATKGYVDSVGKTKYSKATSATLGDLVAFGDLGELSDSGKKPGDFAEATALNSHIENATLHTSASEKQSWNQRAFPVYEVEKTEGAVTLSLYGTASYICGELSSLTVTGEKPEFLGEDPIYYAYSIAFSSGAAPTTISVPTEWVFSGDGCTDGIFTPEASTAYEMIGVWSGSALRWAVRAW